MTEHNSTLILDLRVQTGKRKSKHFSPREMAKSSADDEELRRACEAAIEGTKQKIVLSMRVAKCQGMWAKSGKLGKNSMAKPRVLAISSKQYQFLL